MYTILTIGEYRNILDGEEIFLTAGRISKSNKITYRSFFKLMKSAPKIGNRSDYYLLIKLNNECKFVKTVYNINILTIDKVQAMDHEASIFHNLEYIKDDFYKKWLASSVNYPIFKIRLFLKIIDKKISSFFECGIIDEKISSIFVVKDLFKLYNNEFNSIQNYLFTPAFGWKASLQVVYRIYFSDANKDVEKTKIDKFWKLPSKKEELEKMRLYEKEGPILNGDVFNDITILDICLTKIKEELYVNNKNIPNPIPIHFLAFRFQYSSYAENKEDFPFEDFIADLKTLKATYPNKIDVLCQIIIRIASCISGKYIVKLYKQICIN